MDFFNNINVFVLYVVGDNDDILGYDGICWLFENMGSKDSKLFIIKNVCYNVVFYLVFKEVFGNEFDIGFYFEFVWDI